MKRRGFLLFVASALLAAPFPLTAKSKKSDATPAAGASAAPQPKLTDAEQEEFLAKAKIIKTRAASKGITGSLQATMTNGKITHDAHIQCIDESKNEYKTDRGTELNFRDSYKYNIAAYRLDRLLGIGNVPVAVERKVGGKSCAVDWWVDDVLMDEGGRKQKKLEAPDSEAWNHRMYVVRVFDQLIYNIDRNLQNILILKNWDLVMIDHSRSFRLHHTLAQVKNLVMCDRTLLANLRALDGERVQQRLMPYLTKAEVQAVMARRDLIVKFFDGQIKEKGEAAVLYELPKAKSEAAGQGASY